MNEKFENIEAEEYRKENFKKYEVGIKQLLAEYIRERRKNNDEPQPEWVEQPNFDISDPRSKDMDKFWSGDFEIDSKNFSVTEKDGKAIGFNFYIGDTEFIIHGKAMDKYYELLENKEKK